MNFADIFKVFSKRNLATNERSKQLSQEFRNRVLLLLVTIMPPNQQAFLGLNSGPAEFWWDLREQLLFLHGRISLTDHPNTNPGNDVLDFLSQCQEEYFLDAIELVFKSNHIRGHSHPRTGRQVQVDKLIEDINQFFDVDGLPYYLTGFTYEQYQVTAFPQIIRRDNTALHQTAIEPTLTLLSHPRFSSANEEFLDALKDFRAKDYRDCIVKCGSSFESVMKVICESKGWPYTQTDTAGPLIKNLLPHTKLDSYFQDPLTLIATIRNRLSKAHGAGTQKKTVPRHVASYIINATASAILLLVEESNP